MAHIRQTIRETVASLLDSGTNWTYVYEQRTKPMRSVYPFLLVYPSSESSSIETISRPFNLVRDLTLIIDGYVNTHDSEGIEDKLDAIAAEVETAITTTALNSALITGSSRKVVSVYLSGTGFSTNYDADDMENAVISLEFSIKYQTQEGSPSA